MEAKKVSEFKNFDEFFDAFMQVFTSLYDRGILLDWLNEGDVVHSLSLTSEDNTLSDKYNFDGCVISDEEAKGLGIIVAEGNIQLSIVMHSMIDYAVEKDWKKKLDDKFDEEFGNIKDAAETINTGLLAASRCLKSAREEWRKSLNANSLFDKKQ